jgi:ankyrin repeat protein
MKGSVPMIELLLSNGADAGVATREGDTPVELALRFGHTDVAELLRDARRGRATREQALAQSTY